MNVQVTGPYIYFTIPILGGIPITQTTVSSLVVTIFLCVSCIVLGRNLQMRPQGRQVLVEKGILAVHNLVVDTMGEHNAHWSGFILTIFLSSLCGSLVGMTGFLRSATADLSTTLAWSVLVSGIIWYNKIKAGGLSGWLKGFAEPVAVMTPMNIISEIAQPVSMAFRHFGNIAGGGVITSILYSALASLSAVVLSWIAARGTVVAGLMLAVTGTVLFWAVRKKQWGWMALGAVTAILGVLGMLQAVGILSGVPILQWGIPAVLSVYFDIFSGFVQALVFTLLSMVYIAGSYPAPSGAVNSK